VEAEGSVERCRAIHYWQGVETEYLVSGGSCFTDDPFDERASESTALKFGADVEALHFADAVSDLPKRGASRKTTVAERYQKRCVATGEFRYLSGEAFETDGVTHPRSVFAEERAHVVHIARLGGTDHITPGVWSSP
jgi:hypothetical protein